MGKLRDFFGIDGKKAGTVVKCKDDVERVLLNPSGKGGKYARELREGIRYTNDGK